MLTFSLTAESKSFVFITAAETSEGTTPLRPTCKGEMEEEEREMRDERERGETRERERWEREMRDERERNEGCKKSQETYVRLSLRCVVHWHTQKLLPLDLVTRLHEAV